MKIKQASAAWIVTMFVLSLVALTAPHHLLAADQARAEAPMRVLTEGMTAQQQLQKQAELSQRLLRELPAVAAESVIRIPLTAKDVSQIESASKSDVPLKIGLVKAMAPGLEVHGLMRGSADRQSTHGKNAVAIPTADGGLVWAAIVTSSNAGAIRLHVQGMSLPAGVELYVYNRHGEAHGPYTAAGPDRTGEFWTATIFGSEAILQLRVSSAAERRILRDISFRVTEAGLITQRSQAACRIFCDHKQRMLPGPAATQTAWWMPRASAVSRTPFRWPLPRWNGSRVRSSTHARVASSATTTPRRTTFSSQPTTV